MKKKVANHSLALLILTVFFGLFQAWKESKNPFAFYSEDKNKIEKSKYTLNESVKLSTEENSIFNLYFEK